MKKNSADGFQIFETKRGGQKIWENQTEIHTAMPLRSLLYDTLRYTKQAEDVAAEYRQQRKEGHSPKMTKAEFLSGWKYTDKLEPVITLVIYYGTDEWDGAKSLHVFFRTSMQCR